MFTRLLVSFTRSQRSARRRRCGNRTQSAEKLELRALLSSVTVNLPASQDGTLYENFSGAKANGAGSYFFAGPNASAIRRGLIQFDVSSVVPEGAVITDVTLTLHNSGGIKNTRNVFLHPVSTEWGSGSSNAPKGEYGGTAAENGDATWLHTFYSDQHWSNPGGDFGGVSASTKVLGPGFYEWTSDTMIEDVQFWLDNPRANNGWLLRSNESAKSVKRFDSSEHKNPDRRPELTITYEMPVLPTGVEGRKWHDENVNGLREADEPWLNGWTIEIYDIATGQLLESTVTEDVDLNEDGVIDPEFERGYYSFTVLPGTYSISEVMQDDWSQSYPGFAADFGKEGKPSASGAMSLNDGVLHFDFDVDNGRRVRLEFFVPDGNGGQRLTESRPAQGPASEGRIVGSVPLTIEEVGHLLSGDLTAALVNTRGKTKASGPVAASAAHIVTLSNGEIITERNFGNYRVGDAVPPPPLPDQTGSFAARGVHFGLDDLGRVAIHISPTPVVVAEDELVDPEPGSEEPTMDPSETPRQIAAMLKFAAKRDERIAEAVDRLFGGLDPLEVWA